MEFERKFGSRNLAGAQRILIRILVIRPRESHTKYGNCFPMGYRKLISFKKNVLLVLSITGCLIASGQNRRYSISNAHSHNDYEQRIPFRMAYQAGFGSVEADIFPVKAVLIKSSTGSIIYETIPEKVNSHRSTCLGWNKTRN
jgi:hypothetical protein